jgi:DNA-binding response OmpR family regulator
MSDPPAAAVLLYVEDETTIVELVESALQDAGFEVVVAADGREALELLEARGAGLRGLITDVNLGSGPDGWQVAKRARELIDNVPVIYVSGASGHEWTSKGVPHSVMITKPFAAAQIVVAVSSLLNTTDP